MEEKIDRLADFAIKLTRGEVRDILDYYIRFKNYFLEHPNESLEEDFKDVIEVDIGKTLIYLKIKIKLLEAKYEKWGTESYLKDLKELNEEYEEFYEIYMTQKAKRKQR
jgi:hypothetical protein